MFKKLPLVSWDASLIKKVITIGVKIREVFCEGSKRIRPGK